jgi:hypothetical protein
MNRFIRLSFAALLFIGGTSIASSANLVTNGSFEQGTLGIGSFQGWQTNLGDISTFVDSSGKTGSLYGQASNGLWAAYFGSTAADGGASISQNLATTVNQGYLLSFDLANDNGGFTPLNSFLVSLGNVVAFSFTNAPNQNYIHYQYSFVASASSTPLLFSGSNDNSYFELDNVAVTPTPEPATLAFLLLGALAVTLKIGASTLKYHLHPLPRPRIAITNFKNIPYASNCNALIQLRADTQIL